VFRVFSIFVADFLSTLGIELDDAFALSNSGGGVCCEAVSFANFAKLVMAATNRTIPRLSGCRSS
jgi:hypothetical protein